MTLFIEVAPEADVSAAAPVAIDILRAIGTYASLAIVCVTVGNAVLMNPCGRSYSEILIMVAVAYALLHGELMGDGGFKITVPDVDVQRVKVIAHIYEMTHSR